jgi:TrmH family RNA methyltransferase
MPAELPPEQMADQTGLVLATDAIQDPGNLGTIIRTASWFGVKGLLSGKGTVDLFHPKLVRSTAGATGTVPHVNVELKEALSIFEKKGWQIVLLDSSSESIPLKEVKRQEKTLIIVGNEANGIDQSLVGSDRLKARIASPRKGGNVESLNAAIATSIALYALG